MFRDILVICSSFGLHSRKDDVLEQAISEFNACVRSYRICTDSDSVPKTIVNKDGEVVQFCRVTDFKEFVKDFHIEGIVHRDYFDRYVLEKYFVDWNYVIEREIREASLFESNDNPVYMICVSVSL